MKHDFYTDEYGEVDTDHSPYDDHPGPACRSCGGKWCAFCEPDIFWQECPTRQPGLFEISVYGEYIYPS